MKQLKKSMGREFTQDEKSYIIDYINKNKKENIENFVKHFEDKFKIDVTETAVKKIIIEMLMKNVKNIRIKI